jgi:hypothetical protein
MKHLTLENRLNHAKNSVNKATGNNIIERCDEYIKLLNEFRYSLYKLRGESQIDLGEASILTREKSESLRKEVGDGFINTIHELNLTRLLLNSLTTSDSYEVLETLNRQNYKQHNNWELIDGNIKFDGCPDRSQITFQEAINISIELRCAEFSEKGKLNLNNKKNVTQINQ